MTEDQGVKGSVEQPPLVIATEPQNLQANAPPRIPQYRRDLLPRNLSLSAEDLGEFCELLSEINERAKRLELASFDMSNPESKASANDRVNEFVTLEYNYRASNGDNVMGLGVPDVEGRNFPVDLLTFFASNSSYVERALSKKPLNCVDAFLDFNSPSLKIDLLTLPSNPTENRTVINIYGRDEDWVISTTERINNFLKEKSRFRPVIHGSGTYDYFLYLIFIPALIWTYTKFGIHLDGFLEKKSVLLNVIFGVYLILLFLMMGRFIFQYFRWLFPPMEYFKKSKFGSSIHRAVAAFLGLAVVSGAAYDLGKAFLNALFGWHF